MPIDPQFLQHNDSARTERAIIRQLIDLADSRGDDADRVYRISLDTEPQYSIVSNCYLAGWPYVDVRKNELVLAWFKGQKVDSLELWWRLELEKFSDPTAVDFHTMWCQINTEDRHELECVRQRVFWPLARQGYVWSEIRQTDERFLGRIRLWQYRIDRQRL